LYAGKFGCYEGMRRILKLLKGEDYCGITGRLVNLEDYGFNSILIPKEIQLHRLIE